MKLYKLGLGMPFRHGGLKLWMGQIVGEHAYCYDEFGAQHPIRLTEEVEVEHG